MPNCPQSPKKSAKLFGGFKPPFEFMCCCGHKYKITEDIVGGYRTVCPVCGQKHYLRNAHTSNTDIDHL